MKYQVVLPGEDGLIQIEGTATACAPRGPGRHEYLHTVRDVSSGIRIWGGRHEELATIGALARGLVREKIAGIPASRPISEG